MGKTIGKRIILEPYFKIIEFREIKEVEDENIFGKSFMWTTIMMRK